MRTLGYLTEILFRNLILWTEGSGIRDKLLLIPYGPLQLLEMVLGSLRYLGVPGWKKLSQIATPLFEVRLRNHLGTFHCRKRSEDLAMLCEAYEPEVTKYIQQYTDRERGGDSHHRRGLVRWALHDNSCETAGFHRQSALNRARAREFCRS